jgi:glutathione peroxidase-family protein
VIDAIPVAFLIDSEGRVVWRGNPLTDDGELEDRIERLLDR